MNLTDKAMESVARMSALRTLNITYTKISDVGLAALTASESLKSVRYGWAADSRRSLAKFRSLHPEAPFVIESSADVRPVRLRRIPARIEAIVGCRGDLDDIHMKMTWLRAWLNRKGYETTSRLYRAYRHDRKTDTPRPADVRAPIIYEPAGRLPERLADGVRLARRPEQLVLEKIHVGGTDDILRTYEVLAAEARRRGLAFVGVTYEIALAMDNRNRPRTRVQRVVRVVSAEAR